VFLNICSQITKPSKVIETEHIKDKLLLSHHHILIGTLLVSLELRNFCITSENYMTKYVFSLSEVTLWHTSHSSVYNLGRTPTY